MAAIKSVLTIAETDAFVISPLQYWIHYHELQMSQQKKKYCKIARSGKGSIIKRLEKGRGGEKGFKRGTMN